MSNLIEYMRSFRSTQKPDEESPHSSVPEMSRPSVPEMSRPSVPEMSRPSVPEMSRPSVPEMSRPSVPEMPRSAEPDLIDIMNDLHSKVMYSGFNLDISLPQIAVVGGQIAGKSSVLEKIVGREFLPRGKYLVTKRPTLIQLYPTSSEEYAVFGHKKDEKFTDFNEVRKEIEAQMPKGNIFSTDPIQLKIYSPKVLKLTLVDLPGLFCVAVDNQPESCIEEVRRMNEDFIRQPECLILAVTPAYQDLAISDALEIARKVDPERLRTIGVLTKLDCMDKGTDALDILENRQVALKKGWVGVLNRNQQDILDGKDILYDLDKEKKFFATKACYRHLADRMGTPYLQRLLQRYLKSHIKAALPDIRTKLADRLEGYQRKLKEFESNMGEDSKGKQPYMIKLLNMFIRDITVKVEGNSGMVDMKSLSAGALIKFTLGTVVQNSLKLKLEPKEECMTVVIANLDAIRDSIGLPTWSLESANMSLLSKYEGPLKESVECIKEILGTSHLRICSAGMMDRYPTTQAELLFRINRCVQKETEMIKCRLWEHVKAEMSYVNLRHPDLDASVFEPSVPPVGLENVWQMALSDESPADESFDEASSKGIQDGFGGDLASKTKHLAKLLMEDESTQKKVQYLMLLIPKYLEIVQKQISDLTIKYIYFFLVQKVLDYIRNDLMGDILYSANFASLTEDCEEDFRVKQEMETACLFLKDALDTIQNF